MVIFINKILITGGAGFIGSNFVLDWLDNSDEPIVNLDKLTYAGNLESLASAERDHRHVFVRGDIGDAPLVSNLLDRYGIRAVVNFAAESHVDRSIHGPEDFINTNVGGTMSLLKAAHGFWSRLSDEEKSGFRFLHVSTDEVYGSLTVDDPAFTEATRYAPNSPYSASKAASDHLVRAWHHTYGLPVLTTNCSNNYGPYQFPEKLVPLLITHALGLRTLPIYGDGQNIRDWLYVGDHTSALRRVLGAGKIGETYNIGGDSERTNLQVVHTVCDLLDEISPPQTISSYRELIQFVQDRPGHDRRYAIDATKIECELGWTPKQGFEAGLRKTIEWYMSHGTWVENVTSGSYRQWIETNYAGRGVA